MIVGGTHGSTHGEGQRCGADRTATACTKARRKARAACGTIVRLLVQAVCPDRPASRRGRRDDWGEISDDLSAWTMPGERTKNGVPHVVPLSGPARGLLWGLLPENAAEAKRAMAERRASGALVLPGLVGAPFAGRSKSKVKAVVDAHAKAAAAAGTIPTPIVPWSIHDLRQMVATGLQRLGVRLEVPRRF
jgi:hypothetical protein